MAIQTAAIVSARLAVLAEQRKPTIMRSLPYHYVRALELEGRHPADAGCWGSTVNRIQVGEGLPFTDSPLSAIPIQDGVPFPNTERPPPEQTWRVFYFRRLRTADECAKYVIYTQNTVNAAFHLTRAWATAPN